MIYNSNGEAKMTEKGYMSDFFRQLQELNKKCDNLSSEVKEQKEKVKILENKVIELENENQKLKEDNDRLKKQISNDSNNSSKPPSSDIKPNIPNNREKTNKKKGGQFGHKAQFLDKKVVEEKIQAGEYKHEIITIGEVNDEYVSKYVLDIQINVIAKEYRFYKDKAGKYNIPKEFQPNVQYGNELKTMCSILNTEGIVAIDRLTDFVESITHGKITVSNGSAVNFVKLLSSKCKNIVEGIKTNVLNSEIMNTDATTGRCNNKNICVRNYSTKKYTLLAATIRQRQKTYRRNKYTA